MRTPVPEIRQCFDAGLLALLPRLGLEPSDVAWTNAPFTPDANRLYLRPHCMFGETAAASLGPYGFERLVGVYQVSVLEIQGTGLGRAEEIARTIVDAFRGGVELDCCGWKIQIGTAYAGGPTVENDRLHMPVTIQWRCYAQK